MALVQINIYKTRQSSLRFTVANRLQYAVIGVCVSAALAAPFANAQSGGTAASTEPKASSGNSATVEQKATTQPPAPSIEPPKRSSWGRPSVDEDARKPATAEDAALEQKVRVAVRDRWERIAASQWEQAYGYLTPSARATISVDAFRRGLEGAPVKFMDVGSVTCRKSICSVHVVHEYKLKVPKIGATPAPYVQLERWREIDGKPYLMAEGG